MKNKKNGIRLDPDVLIRICMLVGLCGLTIQLLLSVFTDIPPLYSGIAVIAIYVAAAIAIIIKSHLTV